MLDDAECWLCIKFMSVMNVSSVKYGYLLVRVTLLTNHSSRFSLFTACSHYIKQCIHAAKKRERENESEIEFYMLKIFPFVFAFSLLLVWDSRSLWWWWSWWWWSSSGFPIFLHIPWYYQNGILPSLLEILNWEKKGIHLKSNAYLLPFQQNALFHTLLYSSKTHGFCCSWWWWRSWWL